MKLFLIYIITFIITNIAIADYDNDGCQDEEDSDWTLRNSHLFIPLYKR